MWSFVALAWAADPVALEGSSELDVRAVWGAKDEVVALARPRAATDGFRLMRWSMAGELLGESPPLSTPFPSGVPSGDGERVLLLSASRRDWALHTKLGGLLASGRCSGYCTPTWSDGGESVCIAQGREDPLVWTVTRDGTQTQGPGPCATPNESAFHGPYPDGMLDMSQLPPRRRLRDGHWVTLRGGLWLHTEKP